MASKTHSALAPRKRVPDLDASEGDGEPEKAGAKRSGHGDEAEDGPAGTHERVERLRVDLDVQEAPGDACEQVDGQEGQAAEGPLDDGPEKGQEGHVTA